VFLCDEAILAFGQDPLLYNVRQGVLSKMKLYAGEILCPLLTSIFDLAIALVKYMDQVFAFQCCVK
jgi:hypothetical protein